MSSELNAEEEVRGRVCILGGLLLRSEVQEMSHLLTMAMVTATVTVDGNGRSEQPSYLPKSRRPFVFCP